MQSSSSRGGQSGQKKLWANGYMWNKLNTLDKKHWDDMTDPGKQAILGYFKWKAKQGSSSSGAPQQSFNHKQNDTDVTNLLGMLQDNDHQIEASQHQSKNTPSSTAIQAFKNTNKGMDINHMLCSTMKVLFQPPKKRNAYVEFPVQ